MTPQRDDSRPPWKRSNPKKKSGAKPKKLSQAGIAEARARARSAGRPYPNLVDNMAVARKRRSTKKAAAPKRPSKKKQGAVKKPGGVKRKGGVKKKRASPRRVGKSR
jgi:hypothetical protein